MVGRLGGHVYHPVPAQFPGRHRAARLKTDERTFTDYIVMIRRRWKLAAAAGCVVMLGFVIYAYTATAVYEATATIQVEQPIVPDSLVQTTVDSYAGALLASLTQRVLSTENVAGIIKKFDLYAPASATTPIEDLVLYFRTNTVVTPSVANVTTGTSRSAQVTYAFTVAFQYDDPEKASLVANELARLHIAENSAIRSGSAASSSEFLQAESDKVAKRIAEVQSKIAAMQGQAGGGVFAAEDPMMAAQRYEQIDRDLAQVDASLRAARETKDVLEADLLQTPKYRAILSDGQPVMRGEDRLIVAQQELVALQARYSDNHPDIIRLKREIAALTGGGQPDYGLLANQLRASISAAEQQLATARQTYSEDHPDVVRLRKNLESLQHQLADAESRGSAPAVQQPPDNPIYMQLQTRIRTAEIEINELTSRRSDLYNRRMQYSYNPELEAKFGPLARERDLLQRQYADLRDKYTQATLSESVETEDKGQVMTLIEPARAPIDPIEPNRKLLVLLGLLLGVGAAFGSAFLSDMLDGTIRGSRDIESLLHQAPIAMIPFIDNPGDVVQRRRQHVYMALLALTAIVIVLVVVS